MDIKLDQILFQVVNFGVVFGALTYFLYKPVTKMLEERAQKVAAAEKAAEETMRERGEIDKIKGKTQLQAEKEAAKLIEKAKEQAAELKKELTQKAKEEVKAEREKALKAWTEEKAGLVRNMKQEFSQAAFAVAEKLIGKAIDKKGHAELIDTSIKELAQVL